MTIRQTHTYAVLTISEAAYREIRGLLEKADYSHAFHNDTGEEVIDMHGIALLASVGSPIARAKHEVDLEAETARANVAEHRLAEIERVLLPAIRRVYAHVDELATVSAKAHERLSNADRSAHAMMKALTQVFPE